MKRLTVADAKAGAIVRMPDHRTGRLLFIPDGPPSKRRNGKSQGNKAKVLLPSGAVLSFDPAVLTVVG